FADAVITDRVSLDTPLGELLDQTVPSFNGKPITLVDIATHTSGLPRLPDNINLDAEHMIDPYLHYGEDELLTFLAGHELVRAPGEQAEYSNLGMGLLGYLLTELYDRPYAELVEGLVADPLGMSDTVVVPQEQHENRVLSGHDGSFEVVADWQFDVLAGAGALYSTVNDMVKYIKANLVAPAGPLGEQLQFTHGEQRSAPALGGAIGLAWIRWTRNDVVSIWHNGGTAGYRTFVGFTPATGRGAVVLANAVLGEIDAIGAHLLGSESPLPSIVEVSDTSDGPLGEYLGTYSFTPDVSLKITTDGERIYGQMTGQPRFTTTNKSKDRYVIDQVPAEIEFVRGESGVVEALTLYQNGTEQKARKSGVEVTREVVDVAVEVLDRYLGSYELTPSTIFEITREGTQLFAQLTRQPKFPVYAKTATRFYFEVVVAEIEFNVQADENRATELTLYQNGIHVAPRTGD
ncbi:MAG: serine hydrolase, partial [Gammaproteobacteria bacterium]|nr:serine hydrolase [Gammaproteobacteria bacterium]